MDAIGVSRAAFIGSSLGGGIATMTAGLAPERCTALVLAAPAGFDTHLSLTMRLATLRGPGEMMVAGIRRFPRLGVRDAFADRRRIPHRLIDLVRRDAMRPQYGRTILTALRSVVTVRGIEPAVVEEVRAAAARVAAPTLIIWGTKDHVLLPEQADLASRLFPNVRVRRLDGVGHLPSIEAAATFNTLAMEFLSAVYASVEAGAPR
jgi:pimeloyl-ACP methyl ester carboxylesterase